MILLLLVLLSISSLVHHTAAVDEAVAMTVDVAVAVDPNGVAVPDVTTTPGWPVISSYLQTGQAALGCKKTKLISTNDSVLTDFSSGEFYTCSQNSYSKCKSSLPTSPKAISCSNTPLIFKSNGDDEQWVYADGALLGHMGGWYNTLTVTIPQPTQVIAVKIVDLAVVGGFIGSFSDGTITDSSWKCTRDYYDGWNSPLYDDSAWSAAVATKGQPDPIWQLVPYQNGVALNAKWIWAGPYTTSNPPVTVYCRKRINYCVPVPTSVCKSLACNVSPLSVWCDGQWVKVVQLPDYNLYQTCNVVKCSTNCDRCGCGRCVASKSTCNLLVYWQKPGTHGAPLQLRFCQVPVPGCCDSQCYGLQSNGIDMTLAGAR